MLKGFGIWLGNYQEIYKAIWTWLYDYRTTSISQQWIGIEVPLFFLQHFRQAFAIFRDIDKMVLAAEIRRWRI